MLGGVGRTNYILAGVSLCLTARAASEAIERPINSWPPYKICLPPLCHPMYEFLVPPLATLSHSQLKFKLVD